MNNVNLLDLQEGEELNPSAFNPDEYPSIDDFLSYVLPNINRPAVKVNAKELAINGHIIQDDMDSYLKNKSISSSNLKNALKSPRMFFYDYENVFTKPQRKCFNIGTFAHMAFAEPDRFDKVMVEPDANQASNEGIITSINYYKKLLGIRTSDLGGLKQSDLRALRDGVKSKCESKGYNFICKETVHVLEAIKKNYYWYGGGIIQYLLKGAAPELSFYTSDPETGLKVKVRPDLLNFEENIGFNAVISIKTTSADSVNKFAYDCAKYMYELSEGMYQEVISHVTGRKFNITLMIMLQTVPPYDVAVLFWQPEDLQNGKYKYRQALYTVKECFEKNMFPGFDALAEYGYHGIIDFSLPQWSQKVLHPVAVD